MTDLATLSGRQKNHRRRQRLDRWTARIARLALVTRETIHERDPITQRTASSLRTRGCVVTSDHIVAAHEVVRQFGEFTAVNAVSFAVARGESFGVLDPNGAGQAQHDANDLSRLPRPQVIQDSSRS